jgi:hypothetical protein
MALSTIPTRALSEQGINFRNLIINGDMSIAQRGTSFTGQTSGAYYLDRFKTDMSSLGTWTITQSTDVPSGQGFKNSMKFDCTTADASPSANDFLFLNQPIEGFNTASFKFGSSNAESLTLSFWVKSNKTGTYVVRFYDIDNQRSISQSYTISSASTWEKKTITISGDTVSSPNYDNGYAFAINWGLGAGSSYTSGTLNTSWNSNNNANAFVGQVNLADSTSNEWYITGVQLEVGTSASDFEFLPYDVNLERCKRYFQIIGDGTSPSEFFASVSNYNGTYIFGTYRFMPEMRSAPTISSVTGTDYYAVNVNSTADTFNEVKGTDVDSRSCQIFADALVSGTAGHSGQMKTNNASAEVTADAEL